MKKHIITRVSHCLGQLCPLLINPVMKPGRFNISAPQKTSTPVRFGVSNGPLDITLADSPSLKAQNPSVIPEFKVFFICKFTMLSRALEQRQPQFSRKFKKKSAPKNPHRTLGNSQISKPLSNFQRAVCAWRMPMLFHCSI